MPPIGSGNAKWRSSMATGNMDLLDRMAAAVRGLGAELLAWRDGEATRGHWEGAQLKTEADRTAHTFLTERLRAIRPDLPIISEEDARSHVQARPGRYWLIDPIDGTASFAGGFAGFVTQVALVEAGEAVLAAIHAPVDDHLFLASRGGGATRNGAPLETAMADRRILIDNTPRPHGTAERVFGDLSCTGYVESGSISLKMCRVADGTADLFFKDVVVRDWDIAAPRLVLKEAGGHVCGVTGEEFVLFGDFEKPGVVAASDKPLARMMVDWLRSTGAL